MVTLSVGKYFSAVEYIKKLRNVNFTEQQAKILAEEAEQLVVNILSQAQYELERKDLATQKDVKEGGLIKWVVATGAAAIVAITGLLKFMVH